MKRFVFLFVLAIAVASLAVAGTTGRLTGTVRDDQGQALPGATITISSPTEIGGAKVEVSDADGNFQFPALSPGYYSVKIELAGFVNQERNEVQVRLDRTTELNVTLPLAKFAEEVTVVAETPVVDPTQVSTSQTFTSSFLTNAALNSGRRDYTSVLNMAPGVVGTGNPNVFGSTESENAYFIDGADTTDPVTATFGTNFNFDAIQEISFQTGGFEAEYGRASGGVVNLVTKSGGNDFSGTFDLRYRETSFYQNGDHFNKDDRPVKYVDPSITLGGPILRDRLWFFVSAENVDSKTTPVDAPTAYTYKGQNYIGKLTWQMSPSWRMIGKYSGDPATIDNVDASQYVAAEANTYQTQGGHIMQLEVPAVLSSSLLLDAQIGINRGDLDAYSQRGDLTTPGHQNLITGMSTVNATNAQYSNRDRDEYKANLSWFVENFGGAHEVKGGVEYSSLSTTNHNYTPAGGIVFYDVTDTFWYGEGTDADIPYIFYQNTDPGTATYKGDLQTAFLQDAWKPSANLTLKLGLRYDTVSYKNDAGVKVADMNKLQPRLGIAWDVSGDAKNLVKASYGRFMAPNALQLPGFARTGLSTTTQWISCSSVLGASAPEQCQGYVAAKAGYHWMADPVGWDPNGWYTRGARDVFGSAPNEIQSDLKPTYADELIIGFEREIANRTSLEVSFIDKKTRDIFEDTCDGNLPTPTEGGTCDYYIMANLPELKRDYKGGILKFETRAYDWLYLLTSYTYSKSEGSVENRWNAATDFDVYPYHFVNMYGYLGDDRRHRVKVNGYFTLPYDVTLGVDAFWSSAFAYSKILSTADLPDMPYGTEFATPRGSYRANDIYQLDISVAKGFKIGPVRTQLILSVLNLLDTELGNGVCESNLGCGDYVWSQTDSWQTPRRYELGFRIEF